MPTIIVQCHHPIIDGLPWDAVTASSAAVFETTWHQDAELIGTAVIRLHWPDKLAVDVCRFPSVKQAQRAYALWAKAKGK